MRAVAVFPKTRQVRVIDTPYPRSVTGNQVLLRILEVGICGTDREIADFHHGAPPAGSDHLGQRLVAEDQMFGVRGRSAVVEGGDLAIRTADAHLEDPEQDLIAGDGARVGRLDDPHLPRLRKHRNRSHGDPSSRAKPGASPAPQGSRNR